MEKAEINGDIGRFKTIRVKGEEDEVIFRAAIADEKEAAEWLEEYSKLSRTGWIVSQTYKPSRLVFHKKYNCQFSSKNKALAEGQGNRNLNCDVKMHVKVKMLTRNTKKNDEYLKQQPPLLGIITISGNHCHERNCGAILKYLRPGATLRETFEDYFYQGMQPVAAMRLQESIVLGMDKGIEMLEDGHATPLPATVYYWHKAWRLLNYEPALEPLEILQEKLELYEEQGVTVRLCRETSWAVLVATPVMERAQQLFSSNTITFVDTCAMCNSMSCHVTLMLTATKAGAVPLAVLIHEAQTQESYKIAFSLYKDTYPLGFGGAPHPLAFMTDNSTAEKVALQEVWPDSKQLLCSFRVAQAEWRWLNSNASQDGRKVLMSAFRKIQYAPSTEDLEGAIVALKELSPDYYDKRVEKLLKDKEEWVQLYRPVLPIGSHLANNYAEASVRILKDVILENTKAFNVNALVNYIADGWEKYLETRLSRFAYNRLSEPLVLYSDLVKRMPPEMAEKITKIDDDTYLVPSSETGKATYEVTISVGICRCKAGAAGAFCKHQALVNHKLGKIFPVQPLLTAVDRYLMGQLALGRKCPGRDYFLDVDDLRGDLEELQELYCTWENITDPISTNMDVDEESLGEYAAGAWEPESEEENENAEQIFKEFMRELERVYKLAVQTNPQKAHKYLRTATLSMRKITTPNKALEAMMQVAAGLEAVVAPCKKRKYNEQENKL